MGGERERRRRAENEGEREIERRRGGILYHYSCICVWFSQNGIDDLYSLLCFLQLKPLNNYENWKKIILRPLKTNDKKGKLQLDYMW